MEKLIHVLSDKLNFFISNKFMFGEKKVRKIFTKIKFNPLKII